MSSKRRHEASASNPSLDISPSIAPLPISSSASSAAPDASTPSHSSTPTEPSSEAHSKLRKLNDDAAVPSRLPTKPLLSLPTELMSHIFQYSNIHLPLRLTCHSFNESIIYLHKIPEYECETCICTTELNDLVHKAKRIPWPKFRLFGRGDSSSLPGAGEPASLSFIRHVELHVDCENVKNLVLALSPTHWSGLKSLSIYGLDNLEPDDEFDDDQCVTTPQLSSALAKLTQLTSLSIDSWNMCPDTVAADQDFFEHVLTPLPNLQSLSWTNCRLTNADIIVLAQLPSVSNITSLNLAGNIFMSENSFSAFCESPYWSKLKHLDLSDTENLEPRFLLPLFSSTHIINLESLNLSGCRVDDAELLALQKSKSLPKLRKLDLSKNSFTPQAFLDFLISLSPAAVTATGDDKSGISSPLSLSLEELEVEFFTDLVNGTDLKKLFLEYLSANQQKMDALKSSKIRRLSIEMTHGNDAVYVLSRVPAFANVQNLTVSDIGDDGIAELMSPKTSQFKNLFILKILFKSHPMTSVGMEALVSSPLSKGLRDLQLSVYIDAVDRLPANHIDDKCALFLAAFTVLPRLNRLAIEAHHMSVSEGVVALLSNLHGHLPRLYYLDLETVTPEGSALEQNNAPEDEKASAEETAAKIIHFLKSPPAAAKLEILFLPKTPFVEQVRVLIADHVCSSFTLL